MDSPDRLLPETDFPSSRRTIRARTPGDITYLEQRVSILLNQPAPAIRELWYRNLATLTNHTGVLARLPSTLGDLLRGS